LKKEILIIGSKGYIGKSLTKEFKKSYKITTIDKNFIKLKKISKTDYIFFLAEQSKLNRVTNKNYKKKNIFLDHILKQMDFEKIFYFSSFLLSTNHRNSYYCFLKSNSEKKIKKVENYIILRIANFVKKNYKKNTVLYNLKKSIKKKKILIKNSKQLIYFSDEKLLISVIKKIIKDNLKNHTFNIFYRKPISIQKIVENFKLRFNRKVLIEYIEEKYNKKLKLIKNNKISNKFSEKINFMGEELRKIYN
tara:strand:+ start:1923 stop:2669 length:747 start_codon:yes stop_codon:yes gene_type:complete